MTLYRRIALAVSLAWAVTGCGSSDERVPGSGTPRDAARASHRTVECDVPIPAGQEARIECGELTVPENWDTGSGRTLRLRTVLLRSIARDPERDPFVYLSGGPGAPALTSRVAGLQIFTAEFAAPIQSRRDLVFFDPRGVGRSDPALECPESEAAILQAFAEVLPEEAERTRSAEAIGTCMERLRAGGVDLTGFTSAQMARDVDVLLELLGYAQYNLWGVSYGSRMLQTILRDRPARVRSAIVDSGVPLGAAYVGDSGLALRRAIQSLSALCARSAECTAVTPDLAATFADTASKLDRSPVELHPIDRVTGEPATVLLTGARFGFLVQQAMYLTDQLPLVPALIAGAASPALKPLLEAALDVRMLSPFAEAQFASVVCQEEFPFADPSEQPDLESLGAGFVGLEKLVGYPFYEAICERVALAPGPSIEGEPVYSDVPTLVLHGAIDPICPPEYGRTIAERFSRSRYVEFPEFGHGIVRAKTAEQNPRCAVQLVAAFLDDPLATPDTSCIGRIPPLSLRIGTPKA